MPPFFLPVPAGGREATADLDVIVDAAPPHSAHPPRSRACPGAHSECVALSLAQSNTVVAGMDRLAQRLCDAGSGGQNPASLPLHRGHIMPLNSAAAANPPAPDVERATTGRPL